MLFNSLPYILLFLPITLLVYFWLCSSKHARLASPWLVVASLFFYSYWNPVYLPLIVGSISVNFFLGNWLIRSARRPVLVAGIVLNIGLLGYFKYANFIADNLNAWAGTQIALAPIELPLAISFFTFLQIAYLVDCYQQKVTDTDFVRYSLFVTFFPHLIAGPLVHHKELMPQFSVKENRSFNWSNFYLGLSIFFIGLFKKVFIADTFAVWANTGYNAGTPLMFFDAWGTSLSYTLQLYFDFSGYSDMAVGASLLFNIRLPWNFNSPYKATNIQDFWRRWHITLSRWLREYLYIPLGGNRKGALLTYFNLFITFLLGGLWHGASWTFVIWGALHGAAVMTHRAWQNVGLRMPDWMGWLLTFLFVNVAWVFFRARDFADAMRVLQGMVDIESAQVSMGFANAINYFIDSTLVQVTGVAITPVLPIATLLGLLICLPLAWYARNSIEISEQLAEKTSAAWLFLVWLAASVAMYQLLFMSSRISEFIYFNF